MIDVSHRYILLPSVEDIIAQQGPLIRQRVGIRTVEELMLFLVAATLAPDASAVSGVDIDPLLEVGPQVAGVYVRYDGHDCRSSFSSVRV